MRLRADLAHVRRHAALATAAWAALAAGVVATSGDGRQLALGLALATLLVPAALIDLAVRLIPNWLTGGGALLAVAIGLLAAPSEVPGQLLAGAAAGAVPLLAALARPDGLGMGDVKLCGMLGLYLGAAVAVALIAGFVAATAAGLVVALRTARRDGRAAARAATLPLGPFLALGGALALLAGEPLLDFYTGAF